MKCICWNINGGFEEKIKDVKFKNFICTYDIVFLSECWLNKSCDTEIDNFVCRPIILSKKKYKQGCGLYVMIRKSIANFVKIIEVKYETIVWIKVSKDITGCGSDYYICNLYIPPYNSIFYKIHNCDIFYELENQLISYSQLSQKIFVFGDLNARTSVLCDYVQYDFLHTSVLNTLGDLVSYITDEALPNRVNPDKGTNDFGTRLLTVCKSSGLRIVNGRHREGLANDFTFSGSRGMSVIDYLLTKPENFDDIDKFVISNFTTFSDHAPLHVQLKINSDLASCAKETNRWRGKHML